MTVRGLHPSTLLFISRSGISAAHCGYTGKITSIIGTDGQNTSRDGPSSTLLPGLLVLNEKRDVRKSANGSHELQTKTTNDSA